MKQVKFVQFGDYVLNPEQIASIHLDSKKTVVEGSGCMKQGRAITLYMQSQGLQHTFLYDTPEARAILGWLRDRTEVLSVREQP